MDLDRTRQKLALRRQQLRDSLRPEAERLARELARLGAQRVILFGSAAWGEPGLASDIDLLVTWETPLPFLERTVELYRRLQPQVPLDLLVYTPQEMLKMSSRPFLRRALEEGIVLYETGSD